MTRVTELKNGKLSVEFDSVSDVFRVIRKLNWEPKHDRSSNTRSSRWDSFYTFCDLEEASRTFEDHPDKIRAFDPNADRLESPDSPGKDVEYDITGDFLDIDRYMTGEPEMFGNAVMGNPKNIFCTINILTSYVYYTSAEYLAHRQKRVLRLVDWMETQGVRCQVVATCDTEIAYQSVTVKSFQDPFNVNDLAIVSHPDWLRRIQFLISEQSKTWSSGYGSSNNYDDKMMKYKPQPEDGLYIYLGGFITLDDIASLNKQFDALEVEIKKMIDDNLTFNEEPFTVGHREKRRGW